jgi:predicted Ser/Thr protein kinase
MSGPTATLYEPGYLIAGKYQLESLLGQGGMGAVWKARNVALDSLVAIKVLRATGDKALLRGRLVQEARAAAKLTHSAIVKVFDVGQTESGDPFIVMELLHGDSLGTLLETQGRLSATQAVRLLLPICDALWLAHGKGIVHRDLKPDNVFVVQNEGAIQPTLVDFGIVKVQETEGESHLTKSGDVLGSPDYMSPEQARGLDDVTHLTDVWSFCVVLYETITGRTPFKGANYNALLRQIVEDEPPSLAKLSAGDAELSAIVMRGLNKQPDARFQSMGELGRALAGWLLGQGVSEDICGTTVEAKWLRDVDSQQRPGRAAMASITEAWSGESGSGVRRYASPVNTIPAPQETGPAEGPNRRPRWTHLAAVAAVTLLAGLAITLALLGHRPAQDSAQPAVSPASGLQSAPALPATPSLPAPTQSDAAAASSQSAAQAPAEPVSSKPGPAPVAAKRGGRPASSPPPVRGRGPSKAKEKSRDLMSPY